MVLATATSAYNVGKSALVVGEDHGRRELGHQSRGEGERSQWEQEARPTTDDADAGVGGQ